MVTIERKKNKNLIKENEVLENYVKTKKGKTYYVCSLRNTDGYGTVIFECNELKQVTHWNSVYSRAYLSLEDMVRGHKNICDRLVER